MLKNFLQIVLVALVATAASAALAADPPLGNSDGPITITADKMTADDNSQIVVFTRRVIARQDDLIITCDSMRVHYQTSNGESAAGAPPKAASPAEAAEESQSLGPLNDNQEIYRVDCEGSVRIQQGDKLAVGEKAVYLAKSEPRRLILTGQARIWEGKNSVTGHQVVYYLDQNRSQVESRDKQRVRAFYDQGGKDK